MYRVTITRVDRQEPTIEFTDYASATRYAGVLLAKHCGKNSAVQARITDDAGAIHWSSDCTKLRTSAPAVIRR
jgi:hypothetical protein